MKLSPAMLRCLDLARGAPVRYYKGGWYSTPRYLGEDQRHPALGSLLARESTTPAVLRALVRRGLLAHADHYDVYEQRWTFASEVPTCRE